MFVHNMPYQVYSNCLNSFSNYLIPISNLSRCVNRKHSNNQLSVTSPKSVNLLDGINPNIISTASMNMYSIPVNKIHLFDNYMNLNSISFKTCLPVRNFRQNSNTKPIGRIVKQSNDFITDKAETSSIESMTNLLSKSQTNNQMKDLQVAFASGMKYANATASGSKTGKWISNFFGGVLKFIGVVAVGILIYQTYNQGGKITLSQNVSTINPESIDIEFKDVIGCEEAKEELSGIVEYLKNPEKYENSGAVLPKGESKVPFYYASGSEFDEMYVGTGANRIRKLFNSAKNHGPAIIFIDEIDVVGSKRTQSTLHPYANQTVTQLLSEMDGFHSNKGIIVIGATNMKGNMDKALLRPGRFDSEIQLNVPSLTDRKKIFKYYLSKVKYDPLINLNFMARLTIGATGADIANIVNQAALKAVKDKQGTVDMDTLTYSRDKVLMGAESKIKDIEVSENLQTAVHEAGHSLVAFFTSNATPLHKVTIIRRGDSLGHTSFLPKKDRYTFTKAQLLAQIDVAMGGRVAEKIHYGENEITSGASSDLKQATAIASAMIKQYGMSTKVGLRYFESSDSEILASESCKQLMDAEIKQILDESYDRAQKIIKEKWPQFLKLVDQLIDQESLNIDQIKDILQTQ
ncbi:hypothetical protein A3Q56_00695 [Intoshia linei]|uniref:AAA+ ATPase domain-containing protein n=1 Tax=Intoshia linei TaxID=1819745 RepID=A0A177BB68_9BILA|nr:hypothetical protein A3Q56_00695 [Intoshia linei]